MKKILFLCICSIFMVSIFGYAQIDDTAYILKGKTINDALKESVEPWSGNIFDDSVSIPIVVVAIAGENLTVPNHLTRDEVRKQKFSIQEKISGDTESECIFTYAVFPSHGERIIKKNERIIGVLKKYKLTGEYMLLTAISYSEKNRDEILKNLKAISNNIIVAKKGVSKEEALNIAERICKESGWEWKDVTIEEGKDKWTVATFSLRDGGNANIEIDKHTGKVINKFYNPE